MGMRLIGTVAAAGAVVLAACSTSGGTPGGGPAPQASVESYCRLSRSYFRQYDKLESPQDVRQVYEDAARDVHAMLVAAPPEIRADVKVLSDGLDRVIAVLARYGYDGDRLAQAPEDLSGVATPEFDAAAQRVQAFTDRECR